MKLKDMVVPEGCDERSELVQALLSLPEGFLPENIGLYELCDDRGVLRIHCPKKFKIELPKKAKWIDEKDGIFLYKGREYQLTFD